MQNAKTNLLKTALVTACIFMATTSASYASCWEDASQNYGIPADVLKAVAQTESGFNKNARNKNTDGSYDIGMMQINSVWLPTLKKYGIDEASLKDACINLKVGAWILSNNAKKLGWNWNAIGAYNVGCSKISATACEQRRNKYAWKIYSALHKVASIDGRGAPALAYGDATRISNTAGQSAPIAKSTGKFMVVSLNSNVSISTSLASDNRANDVPGGFMNYSDERNNE